MNQREEGRKASLFAVAGIVLLLIMVGLQTVMVLGNLTPKINYPFLEVVRYISIAEFLERLDPVIVSGWFYWVFLKEAVFLFVFVPVSFVESQTIGSSLPH